MPDTVLLAGSWLLTFLLHSTVWLGGAWLLLRQFPSITPAVRDWVWKGVIVGSLLSPTLQLGAEHLLGWQSMGSRLALVGISAPATQWPALEPLGEPGSSPRPLESAGLWVTTRALPSVLVAPELWPQDLTSDPLLDPTDPNLASTPLWLAALLSLWAIGAAVGLALWGAAMWRLRRLLRDRMPLTTGALIRDIQQDLARFGVRRSRTIRFSVSGSIQVPVAFGFRRGEVCLPMRALQELDSVQQQTMLGHELAHLLRRDPLWLALFHWTQRILFLQPLLILARREALLAAEELCDAWAIQRSGNRVALAECLTKVAQWMRPGMSDLPVACMARPGSPLGRRIDRLLDQGRSIAPRNPAIAGSIGLGLALILSGMALFAPGVAGRLQTPPALDSAMDSASLMAAWNLAEERILFLNLEIIALRQEMASALPDPAKSIGLHHILDKLQHQLLLLEQLSEQIRWNIITPQSS